MRSFSLLGVYEQTVYVVRSTDRGNTLKPLFKKEEPLIELPMRLDKVDQYW
jgi:hypothetical protein